MKHLVVFIACFLCLSIASNGQAQLGLRSGNFAGINGWALNPSAHTSTPFNWEVNLLEGTLFLDNNYSYLENTSLIHLARNRKTLTFAFGPDFDKENPPPPGSILVDFFNNGRKRYGNAEVSVTGPSFYARIGEQHALGIFTRARAFASGRGIVDELSYYRYFSQPFFEPFEVTPFKMGMAAWGELGLNYLFQTATDNGKLGIGISARFLQAYEGIYLRNRTAFQLTKIPGDTLSGGLIQFDYGHTNSNLRPDNWRVTPNGAGAAIDIGATYIIGEENDYTWRLGFSILDIGRLQFNQNARLHRVSPNAESVIGFDDYNDFVLPQEFESMLSLFSEQTLGNPGASLVNDRFGMWLPAALSFQADRNLGSGLYLNAVLIQGIPMGGASLWRESLIALTPRLERRWMEFALPVSLYRGNRVQVGLAGRLGFLTLGTDRLGSIFSTANHGGADFYFALKIQPFRVQAPSSKDRDPRNGGGLRGQRAARAKVGNGGVKCYKF